MAELRRVETELEAASSTWRMRGPGVPDYAAPRPTRRAGDLQRVEPGWRSRYTAALVAADLALAGTVGLLVAGRHDPVRTALALALSLVLVLLVARVYEHGFIGHGGDELRRGAIAGLVLLALASTLSVAFPFPSHRGLVLVGVPVAAAGSVLVHALARAVLARLRRRGRCLQRVVAVGLERSVADLVRSVRREPGRGSRWSAPACNRSQEDRIEGVPVLGTPDGLARAIVASGADTVVLTAWSGRQPGAAPSALLGHRGQRRPAAGRAAAVRGHRPADPAADRRRACRCCGVDEPEFTGVRRIGKAALDFAMAFVLVIAALPALLLVALRGEG